MDALVALGTLALAGVTAWLALETKRLGKESVRGRLDNRAPRLAARPAGAKSFVWMFPGASLDEPWVPIGVRDFVVPAENLMRVGVQCEALLTNEGDGTLIVNLEGPSEFVQGTGTFSSDLLGRQDAPLPLRVGASHWAISPGAHALLLLRAVQTVAEWVEKEGRENIISVGVTSQQALGVTDTWQFALWARPLQRSEADAGRVHQTSPRQPFVPEAFMRLRVTGPLRQYEGLRQGSWRWLHFLRRNA